MERGRHMVLPAMIAHSVIENRLVIGPFAYIKHFVLSFVKLIEKPLNFSVIVAIKSFFALSRITHHDDSVLANVG
jgi:hypothetical protein